MSLLETIIGCDPGNSGAIAVLSFDTFDFIKLTASEREVANFLRGWPGPVFAFLEQAQAYPEQGISSTFTYGTNYGFLRGLLIALEIPFETLAPRTWQTAMKCLSKGDKNVTKSRAQELFPRISIGHANADAFLIAEYGRRLRTGRLK